MKSTESPVATRPRAKRPTKPRERSDSGRAFLPDMGQGGGHPKDELVKELGELFVASAISGEDEGPTQRDRAGEDEDTGFLITIGGEGFDRETSEAQADDMNPPDTEPAPHFKPRRWSA